MGNLEDWNFYCDRFADVGNRRAPDNISLIDKYPNINERQKNLDIIKLEVDMEA